MSLNPRAIGAGDQGRQALLVDSLRVRAGRLERRPQNYRARAFDASTVASPANGLFATLRVPASTGTVLITATAELEYQPGGATAFTASLYLGGVKIGDLVSGSGTVGTFKAFRSASALTFPAAEGVWSYELRCAATGGSGTFRNRRLTVVAG